MTTWQINMIRFGFAGICMATLSSTLSCHQKLSTLLTKRNPGEMSSSSRTNTITWYALPNLTRNSWIHISIGVAFVTFLHPALVYYAMFQIPLALVLTLDSIGPLYSLPFAWMLQKEIPTCKAYLGVFLSIGGIVILSFKGVAQ
jgi:drug/metabolite transporter (DMT)-like permease